MEGVEPKAFEYALSIIEDGFIFEEFVNSFLSAIFGYSFMPVGGLKDRGIDGLEHSFSRDGYEQYIYQSSIEKGCKRKLELSIEKLKANSIKFEKFCFITNQIFPNKDNVVEQLYEKHKKQINIFDIKWLSARVNTSITTVNAYKTYILSHLHEFAQPGKSYIAVNLVDDPRLYVFLRQQWDEKRGDLKAEEILADTLILFSLEETNPEKNLFKTEEEIKNHMNKFTKFDPKLLYGTIERRLQILSSKPRRINYHSKKKGYCLPYETRLQIQEKNLQDNELFEKFKIQVEKKLKKYLDHINIKISDCFSLIEDIINKLFHKQGLEFADFVLKNKSQDAIDKNLPDIISLTIDESSVNPKYKEDIKSSLLMTIRDIAYNGTYEQKLFLRKLSNTYMMLFLLQCDPNICTYFSSMASRLQVYVGTSILVPALSEMFLNPINRNHCNLLKKANEAGVTLIINEIILNELVHHFRMVKNTYETFYKDQEDLFLGDELGTLYIDEIMIRAYFYAKQRGEVKTFDGFLDKFVSPSLFNVENELLEWLKEEFGIKFTSIDSLEININPNDEKLLYAVLKKRKRDELRAKSDTKFVLTIYAIRNKNNETDSSSIFGYRTWWLSKDTITQEAVRDVFKSKYGVSSFIRPDFLLNYISLAPQKKVVEDIYREIFPSLLGVNVSFHISSEIIDLVHEYIEEYSSKNRARIRATLRDLSDKLKVDPKVRTRKKVKHFLDKKLKDLISERK